MTKLSKVLLGLAERILAQPVGKTSCEGSAAALLLAHVAWNRTVAPLLADELGLDRQGLSALTAENPKCLQELKGPDCETMIQELMALKRSRYPADDRVICSCALTPQGRVRVEWHYPEELAVSDLLSSVPQRKEPKRKTTQSGKPAAKPPVTTDRTLRIEWPWSMTWTEHVDGMLDFLQRQVGPGHPLYGRKIFVDAVNEEADAWFVVGEKTPFYAIVYFGRKKRYGSRMMPACEVLPDWDAVLNRVAADARQAAGEPR